MTYRQNKYKPFTITEYVFSLTFDRVIGLSFIENLFMHLMQNKLKEHSDL